MKKILIVEDDKSISNLIKINLSDEGYHCFCAYDGKEAADLLEKNIKNIKSFKSVLDKEEALLAINLSPKQKEALKQVNKSNVSIITGGPGTRKNYNYKSAY